MNIVDAVWEKRNLGVSVQEISFDGVDDEAAFRDGIVKLDAQYQVAKVASENVPITKLIQEVGFEFIEDQIELFHDLRVVNHNSLHQRMRDAISYHVMSDEEIDELMEEVNGGMFDTDRISVDPEFGKEMAASRYANWISDLLKQGALCYAQEYKGRNCAFVILKEGDRGIYHSVLGGYYKEFRKTGLGVVWREMDIVRELGGKGIETAVSSNNPLQLRSLCLNGYLPKSVKHVFVKHI